MANHASAIKSAKQDKVKAMRNKMVKTRIKHVTKAVQETVDEKSKDKAVVAFNTAASVIDKALKRGVLHKNTAARRKSRLARMVNGLNSPKTATAAA